ncbi:MAG: hypothetical protein EOO14_00245 [Chitinophagaceae bacterium]|nr:MAG: hypothetical protein EOO14_00245 [Chitinophagaceae bacterium]
MKYNKFLAVFLFVGLHVNLFAQTSSQTVGGFQTEIYSATPAKPLRILFDYYHRTLPDTKVGNFMVTGSWVAGAGRYAWNDFVHSNTFDPVFTALGDEHFITIGGEPLTKRVLSQQDAVLIINPDNPKVVPTVPVLTNEEILALQNFVTDGGSLMIMINAFTPDRANEDFESVQLRKLVRSFGLDWNNDDTHYSDVVIGEGHPYFYDVPVFHYGAGCTIQILPEASKPEVLMQVASDAGYPDRHVQGPGIVMVRKGKGKMILVGDAGSWTGNMSRPWVENERVLRQLFRYLKPDNNVTPPQYSVNQPLNYRVIIAGLQAIPVKNSVSEILRTDYNYFRPREKTGMPYLEGTANLTLTGKAVNDNKAGTMEAEISDFKWFDKKESDTVQKIKFIASRQGKVSSVEVNGKLASWLAPDAASIVALLPVDGVRPGNSWESEEALRIPILQGTDQAPLRTIDMKITYVHDEVINGRQCRLLRSAKEIWLNELDIKLQDLLPAEAMQRPGGSHFKFYHERGGKLLFKREQWVEVATGHVVKARTQSRILAWVQDDRKPVAASNADKDNDMIMSLAQIVTLDLN